MTGQRPIDAAAIALSFLNTILLLWLGLTVLLNAQRRTWGVWLAGGGLLLGAAFMVSHSAILAQNLRYVSLGMTVWWHTGWLLAVALPFSWYVLVLWYSTYWDEAHSPLRRRHQFWFAVTATWAVGLVGLLVFANPFPTYSQVVLLRLADTPSLAGIPLLGLAYPLYVVICIVLALDVLWQPAPALPATASPARRRAQPWLIATSLTLLVASGLVAWAVLWAMLNARLRTLESIYTQMAFTLAWFDLAIDTLIALAILLLGQAVVSYEIFSGKTLPRRGLRRHWWSVVVLAAAYAALAGLSLTAQARPLYGLLATATLAAFSYALLSRQSYRERERYIDYLRPFVASQRVYDHLLVRPWAVPEPPLRADGARAVPGSPTTADGVRATASLTPGTHVGAVREPPTHADPANAVLFRSLCRDVLGARVGYLVALGPLAQLAGPPLAYPEEAAPPLSALAGVAGQLATPQTICLALDPAKHGGAQWAVPLWSERGLIGALLLGAKRDGGLYAQEEIEIARASGERLIDSLAATEMAHRLMDMQRRQMAEGQVLDRRTRRTLHDEVLPRLHAALLTLSTQWPAGHANCAMTSPDVMSSGTPGSPAEVAGALADVHRRIADLLHEMPARPRPELARLGLVAALRQTVADELAGAFDGVAWQVEPLAEQQALALPDLAAEVLFYATREAVRNAARHGRHDDPARPLHLSILVAWRGGIEVRIEDDGAGLAEQPAPASSGQGLSLHSTLMAVIGGSLAIESPPGGGTRVSLFLPATR